MSDAATIPEPSWFDRLPLAFKIVVAPFWIAYGVGSVLAMLALYVAACTAAIGIPIIAVLLVIKLCGGDPSAWFPNHADSRCGISIRGEDACD